MNIEKIPYAQYEEYVEVSSPQKAGSVIRKYVYHWPLFLLVLALSFSLAFFYLKYAAPGYTVRARLLIKDDIKGNGAEPALQELNLFKTRTLVENELEVLKSGTLMREVVNDLQLNVDYLEVGSYKNTDLYDQSPVHFVQMGPSLRKFIKPQFIEIEIRDERHFALKQNKSVSVFPFGTALNNRLGKWKLELSGDFRRYTGKTIKVKIGDPEQVTDGYLTALGAELANKKSTVVELSIKEKVPQRGKDILNRLIKRYNHAATEDKNNVRKSTLNFIDERLSSLTGELSTAEKSVESFKSSNGLMDISSESKFFLDRVRDNDARLNEVNVQLEVVTGIENYVNSNVNSGNAPATAGITDAGLVALINQLITLELQKDQLLSTTPLNSPVFETIDRQISSTKHSIRENIKGLKASLVTSLGQLRSFNSGFESSIKKLPGQERELITKKRQQSIKEELYVYLLQKREEADVSYAATITENRMLDQAFVGQADSPKGIIAYGMAMVLGLIIPFGMIFGRDLFNTKIQNAKEVQESTAVPILGELIYQKSKSAIVMQNKSRQMIAEQFRALNTNLRHVLRENKNGRVTLLTSGMSGEGKSFVTSNLAASLAASGKKTIILEFDLRNPMIAKNLNIKPGKGLSEYLAGEVFVEDIITPTPIHANLFVAVAGSLPEYPTELLQRPSMAELMDWLTVNFDEILIDTPPIQLVTDAMIISEYSDINLYVVRQGFTYRSQLDYVKQIHSEKRLKNLNIVFNGIDGAKLGSTYAYGYYGSRFDNRREAVETGVKDFFKRF